MAVIGSGSWPMAGFAVESPGVGKMHGKEESQCVALRLKIVTSTCLPQD